MPWDPHVQGRAGTDRPAAPPPHRSPVVVRDVDGGAHFERFFVSAVVTILVTRAFLALTGYPQLGGRGLHVAHAVWGGLAMAAALLLALVSVSRRAKSTAAVLGGAGFGLFVDEIGKFLTRDNNYFFRPAVALIYVLLVTMFMLVRGRMTARALDEDERIVNASKLLGEAAVGEREALRRRALLLIEPLDRSDPRVQALRRTADELEALPGLPETPARRFGHRVVRILARALAHPVFERLLPIVLIVQALAVIVWTLNGVRPDWLLRFTPFGAHVNRGHLAWAKLAAAGVSAAFVLVGAWRLRRNRVRAYRSYRRALHVSLLLMQVLVFYDSQLAGLVTLAMNVGLLGAVNFELRRDRGVREPSGARPA